MNFRASFCDPFKPDIIELGTIEKGKIMKTFEKIPWTELIEKMKTANDSEIHYSPSLEIENMDNKNGLVVSALEGKEWYIFYKRPKKVKILFGLIQRLDENYTTEITGQTEKDAHDCLAALIENDLEYLDRIIK